MTVGTIEWTDATWNPVTGCSKVSPGCEHCYAERIALRFNPQGKPWTAPYAAENVQLHYDRLMVPLRWRKPRRVFVNSMSDLFHAQVPMEPRVWDDPRALPDIPFLDRVFTVMALTPRHTYQILTKRPERARAYLTSRAEGMVFTDYAWRLNFGMVGGAHTRFYRPSLPHPVPWPLANVWVGVSVEDQRRAHERIPLLLEAPAALRFLSCEPLLGPLDLTPWLDGLDWVIVGAESGPSARPMDDDWVRQIRDDCQRAGVAFFFKQRAHRGRKEPLPLLDGRQWQDWPAAAPGLAAEGGTGDA
jgi:protein gp37